MLYNNLVTTGENGTISVTLPTRQADYEYILEETKAPNGYSKSRVGTITFTVNESGLIDDMDHSGTDGYVAVSEDMLTLVVKNHKTGGGGGGGGGDKPTPT